MIAYKGFDTELKARWGSGTFQYEAGKTYEEERSKCASGGFHCAENPADCLNGTRWEPETDIFGRGGRKP